MTSKSTQLKKIPICIYFFKNQIPEELKKITFEEFASYSVLKKNDKIHKGDVIGLIGSTGRSTGPHLDWRINWFDQRLDPMMFIKNK